MQDILPIFYGAALGAVLAVPARFLSGLLLKRRGFEVQMERKHFLILLAAMALIGGVIGWRAGVTFRGLYLLLLLLVSASTFYIDAKHRVIPNELWLAVLAFAIAFGVPGAIRFQIWQSLLGFAVCFVLFFVPSLFGQKIGAGDVKFAAAMGFALGLTGSLYAIACMGALVLLYAVLNQSMPLMQRLKAMIPMGPFLALALVMMSIILV